MAVRVSCVTAINESFISISKQNLTSNSIFLSRRRPWLLMAGLFPKLLNFGLKWFWGGLGFFWFFLLNFQELLSNLKC